MGLAPLGVLDLSLITNTLIAQLENYVTSVSPLWKALTSGGNTFPLSFSGALPDAVRKQPGCQLTFSLFHVTEDKFQRNSPLLNKRAQTIPYQPMGLDLYYLLSVFADQQYQHEQQAMSMALQFFYQTPILKMQVTLPGIATPVDEEFVLTMEIETSDELARLWQAVTVPMRLAVVYKVSVVLLTPETTPALAPQVVAMQVAADPAVFPYTADGQTLGTVRTYTFAALKSTAANPKNLSLDYSPAVVMPSTPPEQFNLYGANLNLPTSNNTYLTMPDGTEFNVSNWMVPEPNPEPVPNTPTFQTPSRITLQLPSTVGLPPANSPAPGVYQLSAGFDSGTAHYRTSAVPFSIAAWIDTSSVAPPAAPILALGGGVYTVTGEGFVSGSTEVLLDTVLLDAANFTFVSAQKITFTAPASVTKGTYTVRIRVNNVESPPAWWVVIP